MKKLLLAFSLVSVSLVHAQVGVEKTDSIEMGATYLNDVYYLLKDGSTKVEATNNWQMAFQTGGQTDGLRINSATATGANDGTVAIYVYPNGAAGDWATMDTVDYSTWMSLNNSDESWYVGALNTTASQFPDFGWGVYSTSTHIVTGDSLYLVKYMVGGVERFKKLYVEKKMSGNWFFKYANVDGSNEQSVELKSSDYAGKNYIYYSFEDNTALDREPAAWDLVLTRYAAKQESGIYYPSTGILTNIGVFAAKAEGKEVADLDLADTTVGFIGTMNVIGYDWKYFEFGNQGPEWFTKDSVAYFIQDRDKVLWKVVFTAFGGGANGKAVFNKTQLTASTAIRNAESVLTQTSIYPNPTSGNSQLIISADKSANALVRVVDINGQAVIELQEGVQAGIQTVNLDLSGLDAGVYFVQVIGEGFKSSEKLIKY